MYAIGLIIGYSLCHTLSLNPSSKIYKQAYKQGQQDCINGIYNFDGDDVSGQTFTVKPKP